MIIYLLKVIYFFLPCWAKKAFEKRRLKRSLSEIKERAKKHRISKNEILSLISSLNIESDVLLHSSEINIGKICCSKKDLADAIVNQVNIKQHTLLVAALSFSGSLYEYLIKDKQTNFDVRYSPILCGAINEELAKRNDAVRSLHPTHSVVAIGPRAHYYVDEHTKDVTPFGIHSPWYKIIKSNGVILLIGASNNFSSLHAIEDILGNAFPWHVYLKRKINCNVTDANGKTRIVITSCHNPFLSLKRDPNGIVNEIKKRGYWQSYKVGDSEIVLLNARGMALTYLDWLQHGKSIYGRHIVTRKLNDKIVEIKKLMVLG